MADTSRDAAAAAASAAQSAAVPNTSTTDPAATTTAPLGPGSKNETVQQFGRSVQKFVHSLGFSNKDMEELAYAGSAATTVGFIFGGVLSIQQSAKAFVSSAVDTKFVSQHHMQSEMNNAVLSGFLKTGSRWGWRTGLFVSFFG